jgi:hypothetical protein
MATKGAASATAPHRHCTRDRLRVGPFPDHGMGPEQPGGANVRSAPSNHTAAQARHHRGRALAPRQGPDATRLWTVGLGGRCFGSPQEEGITSRDPLDRPHVFSRDHRHVYTGRQERATQGRSSA